MAIRSLGFAMLVLAAGILVLGISAQFECKGDIGAIVGECEQYVKKGVPKIPPSQACCDVLKEADIPCFCKRAGLIERYIDLDKVIYVGIYCRLNVPPGTKCGSYTFPPSPPPAGHPSPPPLKA